VVSDLIGSSSERWKRRRVGFLLVLGAGFSHLGENPTAAAALPECHIHHTLSVDHGLRVG
jgi:hypothetical protein